MHGTERSSVRGADAKEAYARTFAVHVGVDTGKTFHKLVARGPDGRRGRAVRVDVSRAGFEAADATSRPASPTCRVSGCSWASSSPATTGSRSPTS